MRGRAVTAGRHPRRGDWALDDFRRRQDFQLDLFGGMRDYYAASDEHLVPSRGRSVVGARAPGYVPHRQLRFELPAAARALLRAHRGDASAIWSIDNVHADYLGPSRGGSESSGMI